jgi:Zn-dependent protease
MMGPAFSILIPLTAVAYLMSGPTGIGRDLALSFGLVAVGLNLFNLLPVEPLDGGVILRSVAARLLGSWARFGLIAAGLAILAAGWYAQQILLLIFGALAILMNVRTRKIDMGLEPLSRLQVVISAFAFMSVVAAYTVFMRYFLENLS